MKKINTLSLSFIFSLIYAISPLHAQQWWQNQYTSSRSTNQSWNIKHRAKSFWSTLKNNKKTTIFVGIGALAIFTGYKYVQNQKLKDKKSHIDQLIYNYGIYSKKEMLSEEEEEEEEKTFKNLEDKLFDHYRDYRSKQKLHAIEKEILQKLKLWRHDQLKAKEKRTYDENNEFLQLGDDLEKEELVKY